MKTARYRAAAHELRCVECRVTWMSWAARLLHLGGMSPTPRRKTRTPAPPVTDTEDGRDA